MIVVAVNDNGELYQERSWEEVLGITPEEALTFNRAETVAISFQNIYESAQELAKAKVLVELLIAESPDIIEHHIAVHEQALVVTITKAWERV